MKCRICNNLEYNKIYYFREMMLGFNEKFTYFECSNCGCLQISETPFDISKYYPKNYYSFNIPIVKKNLIVKNLCRKLRNNYAVFNKGMIGYLLYKIFPNEKLRLLSELGLTINSRILDVGCGVGFLLNSLYDIHFKKLFGIDPYIDHDIEYHSNFIIKKQTIYELIENWDLIMLHHSFEHMNDPLSILKSIAILLDENGVCIISIPIVPSYAWENYGANWVNLDVPRHLYLHSIKSMEILAEKANLIIEKIIFNSTEFQFLGSELYLKNIPLKNNFSRSLFTTHQIKKYKKLAKQLNQEKKGDSAAFFLRKKSISCID